MSLLKRYYATLTGVSFVIVWMLIFILVSIFWTWGDAYNCATEHQQCFCEHVDISRLVAEPINAWSNFFYVGAGLLILLYYDLKRNKTEQKREDYISQRENFHYVFTYGLLIIWIGIASFLMHATWRGITGYLDVLSMNMYISGVFFISLSVLFDLKIKYFYPLLIINFIINAVLMRVIPSQRLFEIWVIIAFLNELSIGSGLYSKIFKKRARPIKRNLFVLIVGMGIFILAFYFWHFGHRTHPLCDPHSLWQWHSLWHFMTALSTIILAIYLTTERETR